MSNSKFGIWSGMQFRRYFLLWHFSIEFSLFHNISTICRRSLYIYLFVCFHISHSSFTIHHSLIYLPTPAYSGHSLNQSCYCRRIIMEQQLEIERFQGSRWMDGWMDGWMDDWWDFNVTYGQDGSFKLTKALVTRWVAQDVLNPGREFRSCSMLKPMVPFVSLPWSLPVY